MANHNKFDINNYIHFGYSTYEEYENVAKSLGVAVYELVINDAYKYLDLIGNGYTFVLEDIQDILDISSKNTIQTKIMKNIDKMYINKPVKDLLYLASGKVYKNGISDSEKEIGIDKEYLLEFEKELLDKCEKLKVKPSFLIKKTFMKKNDIEEAICKMFKKELVQKEDKVYVDISKEEIELIMKNGLKSDKTLRAEYDFSNLNQIQRRIKSGLLEGYVCRFALVEEETKLPMIRYLIDKIINS